MGGWFQDSRSFIQAKFKKKKSNAIGYVTSNFIGQLHLHVRVNFTFYLVGTVSEYCFEVTHIKFVIRII